MSGRIAVPAILTPEERFCWSLMPIPDLAAATGPVEFGHGLTLPAFVREWTRRDATAQEIDAVGAEILAAASQNVSHNRLRRMQHHVYEARVLFKRLASKISEQRAKLAAINVGEQRGRQAPSDLGAGPGDDRPFENRCGAFQLNADLAPGRQDKVQPVEMSGEPQGQILQPVDLFIDRPQLAVPEVLPDGRPAFHGLKSFFQRRQLGTQLFDLRHADSLLASSGSVAFWGLAVIGVIVGAVVVALAQWAGL